MNKRMSVLKGLITKANNRITVLQKSLDDIRTVLSNTLETYLKVEIHMARNELNPLIDVSNDYLLYLYRLKKSFLAVDLPEHVQLFCDINDVKNQEQLIEDISKMEKYFLHKPLYENMNAEKGRHKRMISVVTEKVTSYANELEQLQALGDDLIEEIEATS